MLGYDSQKSLFEGRNYVKSSLIQGLLDTWKTLALLRRLVGTDKWWRRMKIRNEYDLHHFGDFVTEAFAYSMLMPSKS